MMDTAQELIKIIRVQELHDGDLLLVDSRSGLTADNLAQYPWPPGTPRINVLFVQDVNAVRHIPLGWKPTGPVPGKVV